MLPLNAAKQVRIALWLVASRYAQRLALPLLLFAATNSCFSQVNDALSSDARLTGKRSLRVREQPIRDLLADLNLQTGVRFFADKTVSDDRVTVISHDQPLKDSLRAIASLFNFERRRDGSAPD